MDLRAKPCHVAGVAVLARWVHARKHPKSNTQVVIIRSQFFSPNIVPIIFEVFHVFLALLERIYVQVPAQETHAERTTQEEEE